MSARRPQAKPAKTTAPYGAEIGMALEMIDAGKSDASIAAAICAQRSHGQRQCEPQHIADIRNRR